MEEIEFQNVQRVYSLNTNEVQGKEGNLPNTPPRILPLHKVQVCMLYILHVHVCMTEAHFHTVKKSMPYTSYIHKSFLPYTPRKLREKPVLHFSIPTLPTRVNTHRYPESGRGNGTDTAYPISLLHGVCTCTFLYQLLIETCNRSNKLSYNCFIVETDTTRRCDRKDRGS